ncbi:MAG: hypothetical protein IPJ88_13270 [Myxococcales bacterium]|nr:MAG: hypothetical protein IPJ88_13270 [Myxococcales bacterium]
MRHLRFWKYHVIRIISVASLPTVLLSCTPHGGESLSSGGSAQYQESCNPNQYLRWFQKSNGDFLSLREGLGLRESPIQFTYGDDMVDSSSGRIIRYPSCPVAAPATQPLLFPVFLVDFDDFEPTTRNANYRKTTPEDFESYLNDTVSEYYREASGQQLNIEFEVIGWIKSNATTNSALRSRESYLQLRSDGNEDRCLSRSIVKDALIDAVRVHGIDLQRFDSDKNFVLDGFAVVNEGTVSVCNSPPNEIGSGGTRSYSFMVSTWDDYAYDDEKAEERVHYQNLRDLLPELSEDLLISYGFHTAEYTSNEISLAGSTSTWIHELGHVLLGYQDFYGYFEDNHKPYEFGSWMMSSTGAERHPAALEKWLFAKWLEPTTIFSNDQPQTFTVKTNEIPAGSIYEDSAYLYILPFPNHPERFIALRTVGLPRTATLNQNGQAKETTIWRAAS